jgi:hypothetical protein
MESLLMINRDELYSNLNNGLLRERSRILKSNLEKNLPLIKKNGGLQKIVKDLDGKEVFVIGAGPSLDKELPILKKYSERLNVVYIATDMALRSLYEYGITPHYVITCETTASDFFSSMDTSRSHLLAFSCCSHSNLRKWNGKISFYNWMIENDFYSLLWDEAGRDLGFVATGSIVTTQAISIVLGCGISSLVIVANDMAFYDRFYAENTLRGIKRTLNITRLNPVSNFDFKISRNARFYDIFRNGKKYYTNDQFLAAKYWLEELFGSRPFPVVDCSEPGCSEKYVTKMTLKNYFEKKNKRGKRP